MLAAVMEGFGHVRIQEVAEPTVEQDNHVVVRVAGAGVCRTDLETLDGGLKDTNGTPKMPYVLGHENAGWVEETGSDVEGLRRGDPVLVHPLVTCGNCPGCRSGRDMYCRNSHFPGVDGTTWGGFAELMRTVDRSLIRVPHDANLLELAPYTDAGITAYHAVKRALPYLVPGSTAVVIGVGGVGHFGLQLLKLLSEATVAAVEITEGRKKLAKDLGADYIFDGTGAGYVDDVIDLTAGLGAEVVIDFVGDSITPAASLRMLQKGGVYSVVGVGGDFTLSTLEVAVREINVMGNLVGSYQELCELVSLQKAGLRSEHVSYPLEGAAKALDDLRTGRAEGRAVLTPSEN